MKNEYIIKQIRDYFNKIDKQNYGYKFRTNKPELYKYIMENTKFLDYLNPQFRVQLTCIFNDIHEHQKCHYPGCNNYVNLLKCRPNNPVPHFCCNLHAMRSDETKKIRSDFNLKKYGVACALNTEYARQRGREYTKEHKEDIVKKRKQTNKERHGNENYVIFEKIKKTRLERYGDENYTNRELAKKTYFSKSEEEERQKIHKRITQKRIDHYKNDPEYMKTVMETSKQTRIKNNGKDYSGRKKCMKTVKERYGVNNPFQLDSVKDKIKQHNIEKYGVDSYQKTEEYKNKVAKTNMERYNNKTYLQSEEFKEELKKRNKELYGVEYSFQHEDVKKKIFQTNIERYGSKNPMQNHDIRKNTQSKYLVFILEGKIYMNKEEYLEYCINKYSDKTCQIHNDIQKLYFDSKPELALYILLNDSHKIFEYKPTLKTPMLYEYKCGSEIKIAYYHPDFKIEEEYYEIKGDQFFDEKGNMINPYRNKNWTDEQYNEECDKYESKHQCMIKYGVKIIRKNEYDTYISKIEDKYGKSFLYKFKNNSK